MPPFQVREDREFEDIKPFIDNRADVVNNIGDIYQKQPIPILHVFFCGWFVTNVSPVFLFIAPLAI
jgi:hypothetical protein